MTQDSPNKKLFKNIILMFLVYFLPKIFSFFLVPLYTSYLSTDEYGISDLIISTASLIAPFIALSMPTAVLRFTIENKEDNRTFWAALKIYTFGILGLLGVLLLARTLLRVNSLYLLFVFLIAGSSVLADINLSYTRGLERMKLVTVCGVGSSLISILSNLLFIVVFKLGFVGFLLASVAGYVFDIFVLLAFNRNILFPPTRSQMPFDVLQREMLQFSVPTIFSGLSWWVISSSDRYFVSGICGTAENGLYSVAYKIPTILQTVHSVFSQAWIYTLYDSYKTENGKKYIARVYDVYNFLFCFIGAILIILTRPLAGLLYAKDFYSAWKYVPALSISIVLNSAGNFVGNFLSLYKKTKMAMLISLTAAFTNCVLNYCLIEITGDAMGAAIATLATFFVSWGLNIYYGMKCSGIVVKWKKSLVMYIILVLQMIIIVALKNEYVAVTGIPVMIAINWKNILWARGKWKSLLRNG